MMYFTCRTCNTKHEGVSILDVAKDSCCYKFIKENDHIHVGVYNKELAKDFFIIRYDDEGVPVLQADVFIDDGVVTLEDFERLLKEYVSVVRQ